MARQHFNFFSRPLALPLPTKDRGVELLAEMRIGRGPYPGVMSARS